MQFTYYDDKVQKILCNPKILQRKVGLEIGKKIKQRINQLEAANNFNEYLTKLKFGNPHLLQGNLDKCYGISITGNYRIIVEPIVEDLNIENLKKCKILKIRGVLDYHGGKNEWIIP